MLTVSIGSPDSFVERLESGVTESTDTVTTQVDVDVDHVKIRDFSSLNDVIKQAHRIIFLYSLVSIRANIFDAPKLFTWQNSLHHTRTYGLRT